MLTALTTERYKINALLSALRRSYRLSSLQVRALEGAARCFPGRDANAGIAALCPSTGHMSAIPHTPTPF